MEERPALLRYGVALAAVAGSALLRWSLQPVFGQDVPFLTFFPSLMLAGWFGGLGPGVVSTLLATLIGQYVFAPPAYSLEIPSTAALFRALIFLASGVFISLLNEALHRARRRSQRAAGEVLSRERELRRAEQEAYESEERFRIMADSAPVLVWMAGPDKLCDWFNLPWLEFTGRTMDEELGNGWLELVHPDDVDRCLEVYTTSFDARRPFSMEYRLRRHDGQYRWVLDRGVPRFGPRGHFQGYIGSCLDIHDRRMAEEERARLLDETRQAYREAEAASRSKDEFLATLSHELRTPLNAVLGWTQLLQHLQDDPEKLEQGIQVIDRNARAQAQLIEDLLDVSRIVSGKMRLEVRTVDLLPRIEAAIESVRPAAEAKQIEIRRRLDPSAGPVAGDADRLQQIVWNLVSNAVKFTPRGGRVEVRLERAELRVELTVSDTGIGISPEFLPHVFDRFRQFDSSTTRQHGGLGLGLSIVRHLAELHGGTVQAASPGVGQGATFTVTLPLAQSREQSREEAGAGAPGSRGSGVNGSSPPSPPE